MQMRGLRRILAPHGGGMDARPLGIATHHEAVLRAQVIDVDHYLVGHRLRNPLHLATGEQVPELRSRGCHDERIVKALQSKYTQRA